MGILINPYTFQVSRTDYTDDFSTDNGWVDNSGTYTYQSGYLQLNSNTGIIVLDLEDSNVFGAGNLLSNTENYFEYGFNIISESGADNEQMNGFSTVDETGGKTTSQAWLGACSLIGYGVTPSANGMYIESTASGNVPVAGGSSSLAAYNWSTGNFRIKQRRLSATTCSVEIWDSTGTVLRGTSGSHTILSSEGNDLKYCKFMVYAASASVYAIQIPDIIINNGASTPP